MAAGRLLAALREAPTARIRSQSSSHATAWWRQTANLGDLQAACGGKGGCLSSRSRAEFSRGNRAHPGEPYQQFNDTANHRNHRHKPKYNKACYHLQDHRSPRFLNLTEKFEANELACGGKTK